jgi:hypothetical protein
VASEEDCIDILVKAMRILSFNLAANERSESDAERLWKNGRLRGGLRLFCYDESVCIETF